MDDSKKVQEQLLISKIKIAADRNERFAAILQEIEEMKEKLKKILNRFEY